MESVKSVIYAKNTMELVTVGVEFCAFLEQSADRNKADFINTMLKLMPLLYLKASVQEAVEPDDECTPEQFVTEQDYELIRTYVAAIMEEDDAYMDFCNHEVRFSDEPQVKTISEGMADVYQAVRNFVGAYKVGGEEGMYAALVSLMNGFELYWGQTLTDVLQAMHRVKYAPGGFGCVDSYDTDQEQDLLY